MFKCLGESIVSGTSTSSITFSAIPQIYNSLLVYFSGGQNVASWTDFVNLGINSVSAGNNYNAYNYVDNGSETATFGSGFKPPLSVLAGNQASNGQPGCGWLFIGNYTSTDIQKMGFNYGGLAGNTGSRGWVGATSFWTNTTNAVSSLTFTSNSGGNFLNATAFYLYGLS